MPRKRNGLISDIFGPKVTYHSRIVRESRKPTRQQLGINYKGVIIKEIDGEGFKLNKIDKDSVFDTLGDAKRFVDYESRQIMRNPAPEGYNKKWYQKGFRAGVKNVADGDSSAAYIKEHGRPFGRQEEERESFYLGYQEGQARRRHNPSSKKIPLNKWISVKSVKVTKNGVQVVR